MIYLQRVVCVWRLTALILQPDWFNISNVLDWMMLLSELLFCLQIPQTARPKRLSVSSPISISELVSFGTDIILQDWKLHGRELFSTDKRMWECDAACALFVCWCLYRSTPRPPYLFSDPFSISLKFLWLLKNCWGSRIKREMEYERPLYIIREQIEACALPRRLFFFSRADNAAASGRKKQNSCGT